MINAISNNSNYTQWFSHAAATRSSTSSSSASVAVKKTPNLETPVQPVKASTPVTVQASGNISTALPEYTGADAAELAVRMRMSESDTSAQSAVEPSAVSEEVEELLPEQTDLEESKAVDMPAQQAETEETKADTIHEERLEKLAQEQKEAQEARKAYLETQEQEREERAERIKELREAQLEGETTEQTDEDAEEQAENNGSLQLDHTASLLQNYQMSHLLQSIMTAQTKGEDTSIQQATLNAVLQTNQNAVRFTTEDAKSTDRFAAFHAYQNAYYERDTFSAYNSVA